MNARRGVEQSAGTQPLLDQLRGFPLRRRRRSIFIAKTRSCCSSRSLCRSCELHLAISVGDQPVAAERSRQHLHVRRRRRQFQLVEPLPGKPPPRTAKRRAHRISQQVAGDLRLSARGHLAIARLLPGCRSVRVRWGQDSGSRCGAADSTNWIDAPHNRWGFLHVRELTRYRTDRRRPTSLEPCHERSMTSAASPSSTARSTV